MYEVNNVERHRLFRDVYYMIDTPNLRVIAEKLIELAPDWFFVLPSSSTGKYHPAIENGKSGLVRHTRIMIDLHTRIYKSDFLRNYFGLSQNYDKYEKDVLIIALLTHDFGKYYKPTKYNGEYPYSRDDHPILLKTLLEEQWHRVGLTDLEYKFLTKEIIHLVESHSGQWNTLKHSDIVLPLSLIHI